MKDKILYSALFDGDHPFGELFKEVQIVHESKEMAVGNGVLVIWGGGDISPSYYGHQVAPRTGANLEPCRRDVLEWALAEEAVKQGMMVIGVCRGAQMMCAMSGGFLIQDVGSHTGSHNMEVVETGEEMVTSSLHHQMMYPWDVEHEMIAIAKPARSERHIIRPTEEEEFSIDVPCEPEIVWFPKTRSLCIQGHPEFMGKESRFVQFCFELVRKYEVL